MKKLFGVMILAGLPLACGSTLPSAPDAVQNETAGSDASVASLANGRRTVPPPACPATGDQEIVIDGIRLSVLSSAKGSVTVRAEAINMTSDRVSPCFAPEWSTGTTSRSAVLIANNDPQVVTLTAAPGNYVITARLKLGDGSYLTASIKVRIV